MKSALYWIVTNFLFVWSSNLASSVPYHQELTSRRLFVFRSYEDVQMFHFEAPIESRNVTFSLTAEETSRSCYPRQVTIYVQHGSYPVFTTEGGQFPENFHLARTSLSQRTVMSDGLTIDHVVHTPLPGDWFMAAFVRDTAHAKIKQKGLGPSCHTTLQARAVFQRQSNVVSLIPEVTNHQQLILTQKINNTQFYKFLVPMDADQVTVNISKCDRKDGGGGFFRCPLVLSARPLGLPEQNTIYTDTTNCSHHVSGICVLRVTSSPGVWHYVRLDVLPNTSVQFGIQILIDRGCMRHEQANNDYLLVSEMRCDSQSRAAFIPVAFGGTKSPTNQLNRLNSATCRRRIELSRVSMPGAMTFVYDQLPSTDISGRTGLTPVSTRSHGISSPIDFLAGIGERWRRRQQEQQQREGPSLWRRPGPLRLLSVSTSRATLMSFSVQPGRDIGGTLTVALTLPEDTDVSVVNVSVVGCLSLWRHSLLLPDGVCNGGVRLEVNSTSTQYRNVTSVPFPEPGDWYLTLIARCYLHDQYSRSNSYIPCPREHLSVVFHVESSPCLGGRCSGNGDCLQYYSGGFVFSTCSCWAGYSGWACTDAGGATSEFELLLGTLLLTLSNLLFAPAVALAVKRGHYTQAVVYLLAMLCSTFYHACDADKYSFCLLRLSVLQFGDFYCGILAFWVTLTAMSGAAAIVTAPLNILAAILIALGVEYDRTGLWVFAVPVSIAVLIMFSSWVVRCKRRRGVYPSLRYLALGLIPGVAACAAGLVCYTLLETRTNYRYTHSAWHCCVAVAVLFLLPCGRNTAGAHHADDEKRSLYCVSARAVSGGGAVGGGEATSTGDSTSSRGRLLLTEAASVGGTGGASVDSTPRRHHLQSQSRLQHYQ